ncbi:uncharacterized protein LOC126897237 [Daktulosphaira vitifoliae]|uniref:uncharacterized protein LOC126897237 n=1 Tax=Daktulosphaira vitifoliae TaxID=58002 RepID=UPI0021A9F42F|nr:uncharacterized protein LOC126897237 [Daktulosphaira vitifoliae]
MDENIQNQDSNDDDSSIEENWLDEEYCQYIENSVKEFCPRLSSPLFKLSQHKLGPLGRRIILSQFQSSTPKYLNSCDLSIEDSTNKQLNQRCLDRFVVSIPCYSGDQQLCIDPSPLKPTQTSTDVVLSDSCYYSEWMIITQCSRPQRAPEIVFLKINWRQRSGTDYQHSMTNSHTSKIIQTEIREYNESYSISTSQSFQQYLAEFLYSNEDECCLFPSLEEWNPLCNDNCLLSLADDLFSCFQQYQFYKFSNPTARISKQQMMLNQNQQNYILNCRNAFAQYKQLSQLEKSSDTCKITNNTFCDSEYGDIQTELLVLEQNDFDLNDYYHQSITPLILLHTIISCKRIQMSTHCSPGSEDNLHTKGFSTKEQNVLLASVSTCFPSVLPNTRNKKFIINNRNNRYVVKVLNKNILQNTSILSEMMLDLDCLDTSMIDFVTYVTRVNSVALQAYRTCIENKNQEKDENYAENIMDRSKISTLFIDSLIEEFVSNSEVLIQIELLDYYFSSDYEQSTKLQNSTSTFDTIRFLISSLESDYNNDVSLIKYILTIRMDCYFDENSMKNEGLLLDLGAEKEFQHQNPILNKNLTVTVIVNSVYEDEDENEERQSGIVLLNFDLFTGEEIDDENEVTTLVYHAVSRIKKKIYKFINATDIRHSTIYKVVDSLVSLPKSL